jgi:ribose-phosphate pyrophosphokinase
VLSDPASERIDGSVLEALYITDSIPLREDIAYRGKLKVLSVAALLAQAIQRIHEESSISSLFD